MNKTIRNIIIAVAAIALAAVIALVAFGDQGGKKSAQVSICASLTAAGSPFFSCLYRC